jgi:hypothetical protein
VKAMRLRVPKMPLDELDHNTDLSESLLSVTIATLSVLVSFLKLHLSQCSLPFKCFIGLLWKSLGGLLQIAKTGFYSICKVDCPTNYPGKTTPPRIQLSGFALAGSCCLSDPKQMGMKLTATAGLPKAASVSLVDTVFSTVDTSRIVRIILRHDDAHNTV